MWQWSLNWNEIRGDMLIGSCPMRPTDIDRIRRETRATAILSLQTDECRSHFAIDYAKLQAHGRRRKLAMVNAPMLDFDPPDQRRNLPEAVRSLRELLSAGHRVYLHCTAGINRAPLAVLAYLSFVELVPRDDALALLRERRPGAEPSWEAYEGCLQDLIESLRQQILVRAYYLSQKEPESPPDAHWYRAAAETIREAFIHPSAPPRPRLDPSRS